VPLQSGISKGKDYLPTTNFWQGTCEFSGDQIIQKWSILRKFSFTYQASEKSISCEHFVTPGPVILTGNAPQSPVQSQVMMEKFGKQSKAVGKIPKNR